MNIQNLRHCALNVLCCAALNFQESLPIKFLLYDLVDISFNLQLRIVWISTVINKKLCILLIKMKCMRVDEILFRNVLLPIFFTKDLKVWHFYCKMLCLHLIKFYIILAIIKKCKRNMFKITNNHSSKRFK